MTGKRKMRVIFGAGEEIASDDLKMYFKQEPMPVMAFTPDSDYGICNREKGILRVKIICGAERRESGSLVFGWYGRQCGPGACGSRCVWR